MCFFLRISHDCWKVLKKINFNIIVNNDEINDINDNKIIYPSDDLADDVYNITNYHKVQQE